MAHNRNFVPMPDAARMVTVVDTVEARMARHRRQSVIDSLLRDAHAPFIRPGRLGKELRRRIAAEGRAG